MGACAYATVEALKARLKIDDTNVVDDTQLLQALRAVSERIDAACHRHFAVRQATHYYSARPGIGTRLAVDDLLSITTLGLDQTGDGAYEATLTTSDYLLWPYDEDKWPKLAIELDGRTGTYGSFPAGQKAVQIVGMWGYGDGQSATPYYDSGITVVVATAAATTITLSLKDVLEVGQTILVGSEQMFVTAVGKPLATNATVIRGINGTTAAEHAIATAAYIYSYPDRVREGCILQAMRLYLRNRAPFGVMGTGQMETPIVIPKLDSDVEAMLTNAGLVRRRY